LKVMIAKSRIFRLGEIKSNEQKGILTSRIFGCRFE